MARTFAKVVTMNDDVAAEAIESMEGRAVDHRPGGGSVGKRQPKPRKMDMKAIKKAMAAALMAFAAASATAAVVAWTGDGGDGLWFTAANWSDNGVPTAADDVVVTNGAVAYVPGGDLVRNAGTTLTVGAGGSFVQTGGIAWMQISGDVVVEDGGVFDTGSSGQLNLNNGTGRVVINDGGVFHYRDHTLSITADLADQWVFNGGTLDIGSGEFQFTNSEVDFVGILRARILAPQGSGNSGVLNFNGGQILLYSDQHYGYWHPGYDYVNFTPGSDGVFTVTNCPPGDVHARYFDGALPRLRYDGEPVAPGDFATLFVAEASATYPGGADIHLVPQQEDGVAAFVDNACVKSNFTATGATFYATIEDAGSPAAEVFACHGTANGAGIFANWQERVSLGTAVDATAYAHPATLASNTLHYYRLAATNSSGVAFATPSPTYFMTGEVALEAPASLPENSAVPANIVISRPAENNCTAIELPVPFTLGGTAEAGVHYTLSTPSPAKIPIGAASVTVALMPKSDWGSDTNRTVAFTLAPSPAYLLGAANSATITLTDAVMPVAPTNAFLGVVSESSLDPDNWSLGVVPNSGHVVVFSPEYARRQLDWVAGTTDTVAEWRQPHAFPVADSRVLFHTTPAAPLNIVGDCLLNGGYWVHEGPSETPTTAVAVNIGGDLTIGAGAQINAGNGGVNQANGKPRGYYLAGPGYRPSSGEDGTGSSYGGEGATNDVTYGSVLNPLSYGSSGRGDNDGFSGGGLILLNVGGTTTLDGAIHSMGFGYTGSGRGGSTGGSINLTTAKLVGGGTMSVDGGPDPSYGSGSGGRIRVKLTDAASAIEDFTGVATACGNGAYASSLGSAAGTVAWQTAADTALSGLVVVDNNAYADTTNVPPRAMCTHLPPKQDTDASFSATRWVLRRHASVRVTKNVAVEAIKVEGANARIFLNGCTLTTKTFIIDDVEVKAGAYTAADFPALLKEDGTVVVQSPGLLLTVR
ncbi:MAG: hypothetical protein ACOX9C_12905 [Kiritimatiellia bacterium]|jgi:hypothetical protein